ncbi:hypothetical protein BT63DRAFT_29742 [Microthyrium microscopicum]|uniref:Uncharacterized protein n=1 Tax=Microthyrium microscopicum TaxID=703497 RepID=A0A6A6UUK5_9PEZI|nr:hypothetical protein BT63DRAFT_29742 [Microthyrium microscopicum]
MEGIHSDHCGALGKRKRVEDLTSSPLKIHKLLPIKQVDPQPSKSLHEKHKHDPYAHLLSDDPALQIYPRIGLPSDRFTHSPPTQRSIARARRPLRERGSDGDGQCHPSNSQNSPAASSSSSPRLEAGEKKKSLLDACHICHRAPRLKQHLPGYSDCQRCDERCCFICIRFCEEGPCGEKTICSKCCVEEGAEGRVVCLDCLEVREDVNMTD